MHLVQELLRYAAVDTLEPLWRALEAAVRKATNLDQARRSWGLRGSLAQVLSHKAAFWVHLRGCWAQGRGDGSPHLLFMVHTGDCAYLWFTQQPGVRMPCGCKLQAHHEHSGLLTVRLWRASL